MNSLENFPSNNIPDEESEKIWMEEARKALNREPTEDEKIEYDKIREASDELEEERGKNFLEMDPNDAGAMIDERIEKKEKDLKKEIDEMTS